MKPERSIARPEHEQGEQDVSNETHTRATKPETRICDQNVCNESYDRYLSKNHLSQDVTNPGNVISSFTSPKQRIHSK